MLSYCPKNDTYMLITVGNLEKTNDIRLISCSLPLKKRVVCNPPTLDNVI